MTEATTESYDRVLYPSYTHNQTHPDRLAVLAMLQGLEPARVERCRVLELGCGDGSNLVPMAFALPSSEFVGLDRAARPIIKGREMVEALGLKNITLSQLDLLEMDESLGQFDYIIAHGLYSWIPPEVREKLLAICRAHLKPQGIAYVSYNAYPGGHLRNMVRELMRFHVRNLDEPEQRISQATALLKFLAAGQPHPDTYSNFLKSELEQALEHSAGHLFHDELAEINVPVYFHQFMEHAARHELQFLGEADFYEMQDHIYPPEVSKTLRQMAASSIILKEQYLDFLKCRRFRQTLLCHTGLKLEHEPQPARVMNFYVASPARPVSAEPELASSKVEEFRGARGAKVATDYPLAKAALAHLGRIYPQSLRFDELLTEARALIGSEAQPYEKESVTLDQEKGVEAQEKGEQVQEKSEQAQVVANILYQTYATGLLEFYPRPSDFLQEPSERPVASRLARWQIQRDTVVTSMRHINIEVADTLGQQLLQLLDGTRDRAALLKDLSAAVAGGKASLQEDGALVQDPSKINALLSAGLEKNLHRLARLALLIA